MLRHRWVPLTHSELVRYRRAARLFSTIEVTTTLIWWDEKMGYFEHRITQGKTESAIVYSRGACFAGKERVPLHACAIGAPTVPPMTRPAIIDLWSAADEQLKQVA